MKKIDKFLGLNLREVYSSFYFLLFIALIVRLYFYGGMVFSDGAYYDQLAHNLLKGFYPYNYYGYPIFLIRKLNTLFVASSYYVFGANEFASILPSLIISLLSIILIYKLTLLFTNNKNAARVSSFLLAFFPADIVFSTLNFTDLQCAFFINLGIYFLYKSEKQNKKWLSYLSGFFFGVSIFIKEYFYFIGILLVVLFIYEAVINKKVSFNIFRSIFVVLIIFYIESIYYMTSEGNFFYRFYILHLNYLYSYYDFFPYSMPGTYIPNKEYYLALFRHIFILNPRYLFFRRFYLYLPVIALVQSYIVWKVKEHRLLLFWFIGTALLIIGFTTDFSVYRPFELRRSYYIFIILAPTIILASLFFVSQKKWTKIVLVIVYFFGSLYMSYQYNNYFGLKNLNSFKTFLRKNSNSIFYVDHKTKYGIDVVLNYINDKNRKIYTNSTLQAENIQKNNFIILNRSVIQKLKLQGYKFPSFNFLYRKNFTLVNTFGKFAVYRKIR